MGDWLPCIYRYLSMYTSRPSLCWCQTYFHSHSCVFRITFDSKLISFHEHCRTLRILDAGIKPVFVFDGKPPELKKGEIEERREKREEADKALAAAKEAGDDEEVEKMSKRTVKVTRAHNEECKRLLRLMGVPILEV